MLGGVRWVNGLLGATMAVAAVVACSASDDEPRDCSEAAVGKLYEKRIQPLLEEDHPSTCNQCHLSGIDLGLFVKDTPCQTMACMVDQGLVNLDKPDDSLILTWIDRANPQSEGITQQVIAEERNGFLEWIRHTAECGTCYAGDNACGSAETDVNDCALAETDGGVPAVDDPGGCTDKELETLFLQSFFPFRRRCFPCHFDGETEVPEAPRWIHVGPCDIASLETMHEVMKRGFINVNDPDKSIWLLKPLDESLGGIEHGGGPKFHTLDEEAYVRMKYFAERYAEMRHAVVALVSLACAVTLVACGSSDNCHEDGCESGTGGVGGGTGGAAGAGTGGAAGGGGQTLAEQYCGCMLLSCHDQYHQKFGPESDEVAAREACLAEAGALPVNGSDVDSGNFIECRLHFCTAGKTDPSVCDNTIGGVCQ